MDKLDMKSINITEKNIKKIQQVFPNCVTEVMENGKVKLAVDFDALKEELTGNIIADKQERYQFTWPDKAKAKQNAVSPISATLRPCKEDSVDFDTTENLYIEGDNLDVLKLLQETYLGKVKMIYIDPPYNTGNDFVYNDDFAQEADEYMENSGQYDEQGNRLFQNTESNGRFHTDWLNMMYPRLKLAKDLLSADGVIFISIDDNEVENLKKICIEIFGESNFIGQFVWVKKKKGSHLSKTLRSMTEYVLCLAKHYDQVELFGEEAYSDKMQPLAKRTNSLKELIFPAGSIKTTLANGLYQKDSYGEGTSALYFKNDFVVKNKVVVSEVGVDGPFVWTQEKLKTELKLGTEVYLSSKFGFNVLRSDQSEKIKRPSTLIDAKSGVGTNEDAYEESICLFGKEGIMSYPKPTSLMKYIINTLTYFDKNAIILDFFSGSASTAHAVMQLNAEDGGNRKFIMVQLPELCDEKSEAYKAGYKNICEIGKERIRRAGKKTKQENGEKAQNLDIGFRVLKLDSSNMQPVYYNPHAMQQSLLDSTIDNVKPDRTPMDLLFQVMLDLGVLLSAKIEEKQINGKKYYVVNGNDLIACFDDDIDNSVITEIAKQKPLYAVFKDRSFATDSVGINNEQLFKTYSPTTIVKVI